MAVNLHRAAPHVAATLVHYQAANFFIWLTLEAQLAIDDLQEEFVCCLGMERIAALPRSLGIQLV